VSPFQHVDLLKKREKYVQEGGLGQNTQQKMKRKQEKGDKLAKENFNENNNSFNEIFLSKKVLMKF